MVPTSLLRYCIVGVVSNFLVYCFFLVLIWSAVPPVWAAAICYGMGLAISYFANRRWTFESEASHCSDLLRFLLAYGVGLCATLVFISVFTLFLPPEIAQIINIGLTALVIYFGLRVLGFGKGEPRDADHV